MNATETIRVNVNTSQAKAELRQFQRDRVQSAKRVGHIARRGSRVAVRAVAATGVAGAFPKFDVSPASVDVIGEALTPIKAKFQEFTDWAAGHSAAGRRAARDETKAAFAYEVGRTGSTVNAGAFFEIANRFRQNVEQGRNLVRQDPRFIGPDLGTVTKAMVKGNMELFLKNLAAANPGRLLYKGFEYLYDGITRD